MVYLICNHHRPQRTQRVWPRQYGVKSVLLKGYLKKPCVQRSSLALSSYNTSVTEFCNTVNVHPSPMSPFELVFLYTCRSPSQELSVKVGGCERPFGCGVGWLLTCSKLKKLLSTEYPSCQGSLLLLCDLAVHTRNSRLYGLLLNTTLTHSQRN